MRFYDYWVFLDVLNIQKHILLGQLVKKTSSGKGSQSKRPKVNHNKNGYAGNGLSWNGPNHNGFILQRT